MNCIYCQNYEISQQGKGKEITTEELAEIFLKQQENDRRKNSYCLANNISLYRIPYWDLNKIKTFNDILNKKYLVKSKWHNDNLIIQ